MIIAPNDFQSRLRALLGLQGAVLTDEELSHTAERYPPVSGEGALGRARVRAALGGWRARIPCGAGQQH